MRDDWLHTGDLAEVDDEGYFKFVGRTDDLLSSAGHRIGPGEIEDCLVRHPSVTLAAVIGIADEIRGEAIRGAMVGTCALVSRRLAAANIAESKR